ncbi:MAG: winged helix-turn-helix domain-containing protein [Burkholderiaceae bacterium]
MIYAFDDVELDTDLRQLRRAGHPIALEPQALALLELLLARAPNVVPHQEMFARVWQGRPVSPAVLTTRIRTLRRALGGQRDKPGPIVTVHKLGYRFDARVTLRPARMATVVAANIGFAADKPADALPEPGIGKPSVAVLPFDPLFSDPQRAPLADALAHELIVSLSRLRSMDVIAAASSFRYRAADGSVARAARELGARYLVSGSLTISGRHSVVAVELSQAANHRVVWAERLEQPVDDLLALRNELTPRIGTAIEEQVQGHEAQTALRLSTNDLDAWSAYHAGLSLMMRFTARDNERAANYFRQATRLDPHFARAFGGLSFTHFQNAFVGFARNREHHRREARRHAERALELDPQDPFILLTAGRERLLFNDWDGSIGWFERCRQLNPSYALAYYHLALADGVLCDGRSGPAHTERALRLSPVDPLRYGMLGSRAICHLVRGDLAASRHHARLAAREPNAHALVHCIDAIASMLDGDIEAGRRAGQRILSLAPGFQTATYFDAFPFRDTGLRKTFDDSLASALTN